MIHVHAEAGKNIKIVMVEMHKKLRFGDYQTAICIFQEMREMNGIVYDQKSIRYIRKQIRRS